MLIVRYREAEIVIDVRHNGRFDLTTTCGVSSLSSAEEVKSPIVAPYRIVKLHARQSIARSSSLSNDHVKRIALANEKSH